MIGIGETWFHNDSETFNHLPCFLFVNNNRKTKTGGGVGMFISSSLSYTVQNDLNLQRDDAFESIFNDIIVIGTIYRPPTNNF